jgi:hypothetical protein
MAALDLYLGGFQFESQPGHQLSWLRFFIIFLGPSKQMLGSILSASFQILSNSLFTCYPIIWWYIVLDTDTVVKKHLQIHMKYSKC